MPGMTRVARGVSKDRPLRFERRDLLIRFQADLVAATAPFHPLCQRKGQRVRRGHGSVRRPPKSVLALGKLGELRVVTIRARLRRNCQHLRDVRLVFVTVSVAVFAGDVLTEVRAQFPVLDDVGRNFRVAFDAVIVCGKGRACEHNYDE